MRKKSRRQQQNRQNLVRLICVLVVVLIVSLAIALSVGKKNKAPDDQAGNTDPTASQGQNTAGKLTVRSEIPSGGATVADTVTFTGTSVPGRKVTVNGQPVVQNADGSFTCEVKLQPGENKIVFAQQKETAVYTIRQQYVVETYSPAGEQAYNSGSTIRFTASVRKGSTATVSFHGQTLTMKEATNQLGSGAAPGFYVVEAEYALPKQNSEDLDLGKAVFTATCGGVTETYETGKITCKKAAEIQQSDPGVTPDAKPYIDVGSGYIAEVINPQAETFFGDTRDDYSHLVNNYLPEGTVDYCSTQTVHNASGSRSYVVFRSGFRVYTIKNNFPSSKKIKVVDQYRGTLPDHNEIHIHSWSKQGNFSILTLDSLWKAPFRFDMGPQSYKDPNGGDHRSYEITKFTATHIDITFCYATTFEGSLDIPADNPIFASAEIIRNKADTTLRLNLKKPGGFYGWQAYYNQSNQLCFKFLNPTKINTADNKYGADLTGVRVMIDVGHGGRDGGASVKVSGKLCTEADCNLVLANALKKELESIGATVIMNRTDNSTILTDERTQMLNQVSPDICICVHQNSIEGYPYVNGFMSYYYNPFSMLAAKKVYEQTTNAGVYKKTGLKWHYYYTARETACPIVLTENGYMTNASDLNGMRDPAIVKQKVAATAKGIVEYFKAIQ